jgi:hypothetical protein
VYRAAQAAEDACIADVSNLSDFPDRVLARRAEYEVEWRAEGAVRWGADRRGAAWGGLGLPRVGAG